jgi:hypothetical protein
MKYSKLVALLVGSLFIVGLLAQVRPPQYPPPDIIPPEVLKTREALQVDPQHYRIEFDVEVIGDRAAARRQRCARRLSE